jgi:hypothetical protein
MNTKQKNEVIKKDDEIKIENGNKNSFEFKIKRRLALPQLKLELDQTVYIEIHNKIIEKKMDEEKNPMKICMVVNLQSGEFYQMIIDQIVYEALIWYPDNSYVGKRFAITRHKKVQAGKGNSYYPYTVNELE